jgi:hypothetical protein
MGSELKCSLPFVFPAILLSGRHRIAPWSSASPGTILLLAFIFQLLHRAPDADTFCQGMRLKALRGRCACSPLHANLQQTWGFRSPSAPIQKWEEWRSNCCVIAES